MDKVIKIMERYEDNDDFSETLFSYHRYLTLQNFCDNKIVVDMACGTGYGTNILADTAKKVYAFDIDLETIEKCKDKYRNSKIEFAVSDATNINLDNNSIDVFISCETIEHITQCEQQKFISEIRRVLKNNGTAILTTPNKERIDNFEVKNLYHLKELYPDELISLVKSKFKYYKLFYMDINMVSCIFDSDIKKRENSETIKFSNYNSETEVSQPAIYMLIICSNKERNIKSISSVLYDCEYKFTNYIWNQISQKNNLEKELEKTKKLLSKEVSKNVYSEKNTKNLNQKKNDKLKTN